MVDTKSDPKGMQRLRRHWAKAALSRVGESSNDWFAYNVISVSERDCEQIEQRLRAAFRGSRGIVKDGQPCERAALLTISLARF